MGGGTSTKTWASSMAGNSRRKIGDDIVLAQRGPPLVPILINHEGGDDVGDVGGIQDGKAADGHPGFQPLGLLENGADFLSEAALTRGWEAAVGELGEHHGVALVFGGQKAGGMVGKPPAADQR